jgi:circadian clock protein KaiB
MTGTDAPNSGNDLPGMYRLRLFVAGSTARSQRAIENLRQICDERLEGRLDLEVIDIYQQPELAEKYQVIAAPTLVKLLPLPIRRIVGDLTEKEKVLRGLSLMPLFEASEDAG